MVALAQGASAPAGYWYEVTLEGAAAGATATIGCYDSVDDVEPFWTESVITSSSGTYTNDRFCSSADGPSHWVAVEDVESNRVDW